MEYQKSREPGTRPLLGRMLGGETLTEAAGEPKGSGLAQLIYSPTVGVGTSPVSRSEGVNSCLQLLAWGKATQS